MTVTLDVESLKELLKHVPPGVGAVRENIMAQIAAVEIQNDTPEKQMVQLLESTRIEYRRMLRGLNLKICRDSSRECGCLDHTIRRVVTDLGIEWKEQPVHNVIFHGIVKAPLGK